MIIVGRRPDGGHRDRLWDFCKARWLEQLGWRVVQGFHLANERPEFCLAVASNRAAHDAGPYWDVAVYVGADWMAGTGYQVEWACTRALELGQLVFAHDETVVLSETATARTIAGPADAPIEALGLGAPDAPGVDGTVHPNTFSGVLAVPRTLWAAVGGFDERFVGWGWDDLAFWAACTALGGGYERVPGRIYHLWHPTSWDDRENAPTHGPNQVLGERYLAAKWDGGLMYGILREPGGPLHPEVLARGTQDAWKRASAGSSE